MHTNLFVTAGSSFVFLFSFLVLTGMRGSKAVLCFISAVGHACPEIIWRTIVYFAMDIYYWSLHNICMYMDIYNIQRYFKIN